MAGHRRQAGYGPQAGRLRDTRHRHRRALRRRPLAEPHGREADGRGDLSVCSPALRDKLDLCKPADLTRHTLIHDLSVDPSVGFITWEAWLRSAGVVEAA